jgi:UDP-2,4-diacetamido-2,4,6-trideoxy-beta-L-altropyranose hydrolase
MTRETGMLVIRADAGGHLGTGHVMRSLALAQAWLERGGRAALATASLPEALERRLYDEGVRTERLTVEMGSETDARETAQLAARLGARWVLLDGYQFDGEYQRTLKTADLRILAVDDFGHAKSYWADLVLNQDVQVLPEWYEVRQAYTRLLVGPRYAPLRREFVSWRGWSRSVADKARTLLITLGGTDPTGVTIAVLAALSQLPRIEWQAEVVAGANPRQEEIRSLVERMRLPVRVEGAVTDMPERIRRADLAVSAGGTTCWELAFLGVPALILVTADNQVRTAQGLHEAGAALNLGWAADVPAEKLAASVHQLMGDFAARRSMADRGQSLVDGKGSERVIAAMMEVG